MTPQKNLSNKIVIVTGATSGIGLSSVQAFAAQSDWIIGVGRDQGRCQAAESSIRAAFPNVQVKYLIADLSSLGQVRSLVESITETLKQWGKSGVDVLVNNAGTYADHYIKTIDSLELTMAVNHFAPFLLTMKLLPLLQNVPYGRVITVSSASHYRTWINIKRLNNPIIFNGLWAYKVSKLANVLFTLEFNRRMAQTTVRAYAVDPGLVNTDIGAKGTRGISNLVWRIRQRSGTKPEVPAKTVLYLGSERILSSANEYYWRDLQPKMPSRQARNVETAQALWELSSKICNI
jgi:NAD(P)-dependent dehydrogenase (short-subunit alcohol dehydrogenase family)